MVTFAVVSAEKGALQRDCVMPLSPVHCKVPGGTCLGIQEGKAPGHPDAEGSRFLQSPTKGAHQNAHGMNAKHVPREGNLRPASPRCRHRTTCQTSQARLPPPCSKRAKTAGKSCPCPPLRQERISKRAAWSHQIGFVPEVEALEVSMHRSFCPPRGCSQAHGVHETA